MTDKKKILITGLSITTLIFIILGLFDIFKPKAKNGQFVNESAFKSNLSDQLKMTPQTLDQLRKYNVTPDKELKLEFFFYTNTADKAEKLASAVKKLKYTVQHDISSSNDKLFAITGWTTKMKMADEVVLQWTRQMCELGCQFDCEFDGWGTEPDQE